MPITRQNTGNTLIYSLQKRQNVGAPIRFAVEPSKWSIFDHIFGFPSSNNPQIQNFKFHLICLKELEIETFCVESLLKLAQNVIFLE